MEKYIQEWIIDYVSSEFPGVYRRPIIGFAATTDNRFIALRKIIDEKHLLPDEILSGAKTVIAYFLPFSKEVSESNVSSGEASLLWAHSYIETNKNIQRINEALQLELKKFGGNLGIIPATHNFDKEKLISYWSHRHVAEICGIGSFGLNNMLITESGCSGRIGTVVTDVEIIFNEVINKKEHCLYQLNGSCKQCIHKCEIGALTIEGFDRHKCYRQCLMNEEKFKELGQADVCGKCLVDLPCTYKSPARL